MNDVVDPNQRCFEFPHCSICRKGISFTYREIKVILDSISWYKDLLEKDFKYYEDKEDLDFCFRQIVVDLDTVKKVEDYLLSYKFD